MVCDCVLIPGASLTLHELGRRVAIRSSPQERTVKRPGPCKLLFVFCFLISNLGELWFGSVVHTPPHAEETDIYLT